uniref:Protein phosphatase 1 regulatory inhibitor subunit 1C n=1 Tax=Ficedula albicollis TaxID=59894 RepID=A0A803VLB6_FICAL
MEPNSPKKIQFAVPLFQSQIDPEAAEQIRKRRPTPASLVIMNEHMPPEKDEKRTNISQAESQSASPKQRKQSVFTPPALKGTASSCPALPGPGLLWEGTVAPEQCLCPGLTPAVPAFTLLPLPGTAHLPALGISPSSALRKVFLL